MPTFTRQERLKSRKVIGSLFRGGYVFMAYPLRVVWQETASPAGIQIAISVPKRTFKTAVQRNLLKRRIRAAYQAHKHELCEKLAGRNIAFMLMYVAKEELPFAEITSGIAKMIRKFPG